MKGGPHDTSPLGKGAGPRRLTDFEREVAHALIRAGHSEQQAIQIARGRIADWAAGRGNVSAQTRAKARASMAQRARLTAHDLSVPQGGPVLPIVSASGGSATTVADKVKKMTPKQKRALALALMRKKWAAKK